MLRPFPPLLCALRENKTVRSMGPKVDNIYTIRAGLLQMVSYLGFINNYKEPQLRLVFLRYSANVASTFPWVVTYGIRVSPVTSCGLRDTTPQSGP